MLVFEDFSQAFSYFIPKVPCESYVTPLTVTELRLVPETGRMKSHSQVCG